MVGKGKKDSGMTLVEVLVSILIFTAVMAAVYVLLRGSIKGAFSTQEDLALQEASQRAMNGIMADISQATVIFEANPGLLRFRAGKGEVTYAWFLEELSRNEVPVGLVRKGETGFSVLAATFSYFGSDISLDKDENGEIDGMELDVNGDGEISGPELAGITLIRLSATFSRKGRRFSLQSSVRLLSGATGRR